eukprot:1412228-Pyramimonas_sp.AAC.1
MVLRGQSENLLRCLSRPWTNRAFLRALVQSLSVSENAPLQMAESWVDEGRPAGFLLCPGADLGWPRLPRICPLADWG